MNLRDTRLVGAPGYRLIRWIGASGSASLYIAADLSNGRPAAVKIFHRVDAAVLARLEQRLQANARLSHPNIVRVRDIGRTTDGRLFHSMPLLLGFEQVHHDLIGKQRRIAVLLRDLLDGLDYAHRCGIVHGGIKPSNVLFDRQGRAYLADFGIAHCVSETDALHPDAARYLSPEQVRGDPPDLRSDVYGIGVLAYELLAGASPIQRRDATTAHAMQTVLRLPPGTGAWQLWIDRALAESPERRFQSTQEMTDILSVMIDGGHGGHGHAARTAPRQRAPKWKLPVAVAVAMIVALAGWEAWEQRGTTATGNTTAPVAAPAAAAVETPALSLAARPAPALTAVAKSPVATQPAPATTVVANTASLSAEHAQTLIATADTLRARGHLFSPPFDNAASHYLAALAFDPGNPAANAGIAAMLATLRNRLDKTWRDSKTTTETVGMLRQGDELAGYANVSARRAWRRYHRQLAQRVGYAVVQAARAHDAMKVAALEPLAKALPAKFPTGFDLAKAQHMANTPVVNTPRTGEHMRDPHGPLLVYVPAAGGTPAFAIAQVEVTRADYAAFARATGRPAAKCLEAHNPFSRLRHLTWQAPGFAQGGDHPVVCVSWDDAAAYATWLSKTTGQHYQLVSNEQWLRAARGMPKGDPCKLGNVDDASRQSRLDNDRWSCNDGAAQTAPVGHYAASAVGAYDMYGNVSEWLAGGSPGLRLFRGISWRDGSHETPLGGPGTADSDVGYTSVGFRVVRVIDSAHPAPPAISDR